MVEQGAQLSWSISSDLKGLVISWLVRPDKAEGHHDMMVMMPITEAVLIYYLNDYREWL